MILYRFLFFMVSHPSTLVSHLTSILPNAQLMNANRVFCIEQLYDLPVEFGSCLKVDPFDIEDQDREPDLTAKVLEIGLLNFLQVLWADVALEGAAALLDVVHQVFYRAMKVYQQLRFGESSVQDEKQPLKKAVFIWIQVFLGEQQGFVKKVIGDNILLEEILLGKFFL